MPLPTRLLRLPPRAVTSTSVKSLLLSDRVKLTVTASPAASTVLGVLMVTVGVALSMVRGRLTDVLVWPVALLAVDDAVEGLKCTRQTLPSSALGAWIERLGTEIADAGKRAQFTHAARKLGRLE